MPTIFDTFITPSCHDEVKTLYQDGYLVLINKLSGLLNLLSKNPQNSDSVYHRLIQIYPGCTLMYRLDLGTPGLVVATRNKAANAVLCQQFNQRTATKVYNALLCGHLENDKGVTDAVVAKDPALFPLMSICTLSNRPTCSRYQVAERFYRRQKEGTLPLLARVQLTPETGYTHQLRIHY